MQQNILNIILFLISFSMFSQDNDRKNWKGKVSAPAQSLEGIYVLNLTSKKETATKEGGYFTIPAKEGDSIMFSSIQFKGKTIVLDSKSWEDGLYFVKLETLINQLDEVMVVQYKGFDAYSMGIIPKPAKVYTPAERKLRTATGLDAKVGLSSSMTIDPLFNMLSGRTAMLKRNVEVEKKERWIDHIENLFEEEYFTEKLKIPAEHVKGFQFFVVENDKFVKTLSFKNKAMAPFLLGELAKQYTETLVYEK
jgi:hypothetical protein